MPKQTQEDYLRAIFCIGEEGDGEARSIDVVRYLNISKPAVSSMLKKIREEGFIEMAPYSSIALTLKGLKKAKQITYKHRVAEVFLKEILNMDADKVHEQAHELEHSLSDEAADKLFEILKHPRVCPCGYPILKP